MSPSSPPEGSRCNRCGAALDSIEVGVCPSCALENALELAEALPAESDRGNQGLDSGLEWLKGSDPDKELVATVPAHATTGPITVITAGGNLTSLSPFTVPVPLAMTLSGKDIVQLSWCADACDFVLECSSSLTTAKWQRVATSPCVGADAVTWTGPLVSKSQFFRLRQP